MVKTLKQVKKEVTPGEFYRPSEIAKRGWIIDFKGKGRYAYILKLIRLNRLRARDFGLGKTPYYKVLGRELIRYLENIF